MAARKKTVIVAYERKGPRKLEWHRSKVGLYADGLRGRYVIVERKERVDRKRKLLPWAVVFLATPGGDGVEIGSRERIEEAKRVAQKHDQGANAVPSGSQPVSYRRRVHDCLVAMKSPDPLADVEVSGSYIDRMEVAGVDPAVTASVVFATRHHGHFGGPKHAEFTAEEAKKRAKFPGGWTFPTEYQTAPAPAPPSSPPVGNSLAYIITTPSDRVWELSKYGQIAIDGDLAMLVGVGRARDLLARSGIPGKVYVESGGRLVPAGEVGESPTRSEWEVVVMGVPPNLKDAISALAPSGASQIGSSLTLHGFYDDEKATAVARRITHQYGLLTTNGPKRWAVAAERSRSMEANDSAASETVVEIAWDFDADAKRFAQLMPATSAHGHVSRTVGSRGDVERELQKHKWRGEYTIRGRSGASECQPFTKLVRDPARFNACMIKSKQVGPIENSRGIYDVVVDDLSKQDQECFVVLCLDFRGAVRDYVEVARGQRHRVAVDAEDVLRPVILSGCDGFAICHNHPSGIAEPSEADGELTKRIRRAAEVACPTVTLVDHVVIGKGQWYSFTDKKLHKVK